MTQIPQIKGYFPSLILICVIYVICRYFPLFLRDLHPFAVNPPISRYHAPMNDRLKQLQKLHAADPEDADITYMIAMEHTKLEGDSGGDASAVIDWLNKTLDLDPNYLYAYFQKAKAQSELGNDDQAKATLQLGIQKAKSALDSKAVSELSELHQSME